MYTSLHNHDGKGSLLDSILKIDDFISFCKANLEGNRYGNDADNILYNILVDVSSSLKNKRKNGFTSYEDFSKSINRLNNDNLINYIKRVMESDSITDVQKNSLSSLITEETKDGSKKHAINITKDNFVVFMTILSNKLDISSGLFQLTMKNETGFSLKYNPFGLILDKIKGLNIYNYNAYDIKNIERVGDQNVYSVKTSLKKESKTIYFVSPNESSFNLESSKNLYNTKQDAINAANRASIKISEILPFTDIHDKGNDLDDNKIIVMAEDPIYTLKKGSVRSVRIKPEVSTDSTIRTVRILNNLKTDFSDVNIGTKITTSSAVADRISTFVNEYIYRERAKTEEEENEVNEVNQFIENLNEAFNGSYDAWCHFIDSINNKIFIDSTNEEIVNSDEPLYNYLQKFNNQDIINMALDSYNAERESWVVTNVEQENKKFTLVKPARFSSRPVEKQGSIDNPIIETNLLLRNMVSTLESSFGIKCKEVTRKKFMEDFKLTSLSESLNAITYQGNVYLITDSEFVPELKHPMMP